MINYYDTQYDYVPKNGIFLNKQKIERFCLLFVLDVLHDLLKNSQCILTTPELITNLCAAFVIILNKPIRFKFADIISEISKLGVSKNCKGNCELCEFEKKMFQNVKTVIPNSTHYVYNDTNIILKNENLFYVTELQMFELYRVADKKTNISEKRKEWANNDYKRNKSIGGKISLGEYENKYSKPTLYTGSTIRSFKFKINLPEDNYVNFIYDGTIPLNLTNIPRFTMVNKNEDIYLKENLILKNHLDHLYEHASKARVSNEKIKIKNHEILFDGVYMAQVCFSKFSYDMGHIILAKAMANCVSTRCGKNLIPCIKSNDYLMKVIASEIFEVAISV